MGHYTGNEHQKNNWYLHEGEFRKFLLKDPQKNALSIGMIFEGRAPDQTQLCSINTITESLETAFSILGVKFVFDSVTFSKNSPEKMKFENCNINQLNINNSPIINNIYTKDDKSNNIVSIVTLVVSSVLMGPGFVNDLEKLKINLEQKMQLEICARELKKKIEIKEFYINEGTTNCIGYDGEKLKKTIIDNRII